MHTHFRPIPFSPLDPVVVCVEREHGNETLTLEHPAIYAMTDFRTTPAITVPRDLSIDKALERMKTVKVRMLLVADEDELIHGVITVADIQGERALEFAQLNRVRREDVHVEDIMIDNASLYAFKLSDILRSTVGDVALTMKNLGIQHVLVSSRDQGEPRVRGLFSSAEMARQLKLELAPMNHATNFSELGRALFPSMHL